METCDDGREMAGVDAGGDLLGGGGRAEARRAPAPPRPAPESHPRYRLLRQEPVVKHLLKHHTSPQPERESWTCLSLPLPLPLPLWTLVSGWIGEGRKRKLCSQ